MKTFKKAITLTIPVMLGYISVGMAFGLVFSSTGFNNSWGILMSVIVYAGSMQFILTELMLNNSGLIQIAILTFFVNMRHIFYGFSFIDKFKTMKNKHYMIFSLTDETYSLLCSLHFDNTKNSKMLFFLISCLNQIYWIVGTFIGLLFGNILNFNTAGIDFAMTALFIVILLEQLKSRTSYIPVILGIVSSIISILIFNADNMIMPTMILIVFFLTIFKKSISKRGMPNE